MEETKAIKEPYDPDKHGDEYDDIIDNLLEAYENYIRAIESLQIFVFEHDVCAPDLYNSAAGKYGDEAKYLASQSYNRLSRLFYSEDEEEY